MALFGSSRYMAFTVEGFSLRMLVFSGKKIESWYSIPLSPSWVKEGQINAPGDVGRVMAETVKSKALPAKGAVSAIASSGSTSQVLNLPKLSKNDLEKTVTWEMKRMMPGSADVDYIYWQSLAARSTKLQQAVFALAVPQTHVQNTVSASRAAGMTLRGIELKPFALTRAINCERGIILNGEVDVIEIVVIDRFYPALFRAIPIKETAFTPDAATQVIMRELPFTIDYYNRSHPESGIAPDTAVYLSGGLALEPDMAQKVTRATGRGVSRVEPPPGCPDNFPLEQQLTNVGLMLKAKWD